MNAGQSKLQSFMDGESRKRSLLLLSIMIGLSVCVIYFQHLFTDKLFMYADIGSDTKNIYTPVYSSIVTKLRAGDFTLWDSTMGLGSSLISFQSTIFDPFAVIIYIVGYFFGVPSIAYSLIFVNILKVFSAGWACYALLGRYRFSENAKVLSSYIYAFNGFMILWGQHYFFATAVVITPLLLLSAENALAGEKHWEIKLALCVAVLFLFSIYIGFMALAFSLIYTLLRYLKRTDRVRMKPFIIFFCKVVGCVALGLLLSSVILLPVAYRMIAVGGRVGGSLISNISKYMGELYRPEYYKTLIQRIFSNNFQGAGDMFYGVAHEMNSVNDVSRSNYYEAPQLFFSVLLMLLTPTYFINSWRRNRLPAARAAMVTGMLALAIMLLTPIGGTIFNGFSYPFSRHTFLLMPLFAIMVASALDETVGEKRAAHPIAMIISAALTILIIVLSFKSSRWEIMLLKVFTCLALAGAALMLLWLGQSARGWSALPALLLVGIVMLNVISESFITVNDRMIPPKAWAWVGQSIYDADTTKALEYIKEIDDGFYRVEKTYTPGTNEGMIQGYMGFAMYNSNISGTYGEFLSKVTPGAVLDVASSVVVTDGAIPDFLGVKYLLTRDDPALYYGYELIMKVGEVNILKNSGASGLATLYDTVIEHADFTALPVLTRRQIIESAAVVPDEVNLGLDKLSASSVRAMMRGLEKVDIDLNAITANDCSISERRSPPLRLSNGGAEAYIDIPITSRNDNNEILFEATLRCGKSGRVIVNYFRGGAIIEKTALNFALQADIPRTVQAVLPPGVEAVRISVPNDMAIERINAVYSVPEYAEYIDQRVKMNGSGNIELNVRTDSDGLLVTSIPWEPGWTLYEDGQEQEIVMSNLTFIGAMLPAGEHTLALKYRTPLMLEGAFLSLLGMVILAILCCKKRKSPQTL